MITQKKLLNQKPVDNLLKDQKRQNNPIEENL